MRAVLLLVSVAGFALAAALRGRHQGTVEWGNRLYHEGDLQVASDIYRSRVEEDLGGGAAYNLGTSLLTVDATEAEEFLWFATDMVDSAAIQRAHYNLGLLFLARAAAAPALELALAELTSSVGSGRAALRLAPGDDNARWNLAMAQYMLDSLMNELDPGGAEEQSEPDPDEGGLVIPELARLGRPQGREFEAPAGEDPGSLSPAEATALLRGVETDVEELVRAILWSRRPRVDPFMEPYPGGAW
jgi:hypothetical protein